MKNKYTQHKYKYEKHLFFFDSYTYMLVESTFHDLTNIY